MKHSASFLLAVVMLSGCETVQSILNDILDSQRPKEGAEALQYRECFEAGRRSEAKGDVRIAGDTYGRLIGRGSRYGEYGLAMLVLRREPGSREAIKHLIACAKRSSHTSDMFPDSAMDSAFSAAAMSKLAEMAISEHDRDDVAVSLRNKMCDIITPQVRAWAAEQKADSDSKAIYEDIISAVESCRRSGEYVKVFEWHEISKVFLDKTDIPSAGTDLARPRPPKESATYSVEKLAKVSDAACKYDFEIRLTGSRTLEDTSKLKSELRRLVMKEYVAENPRDSVEDVRVSMTWNQSGSTIIGTAMAIKVSTVRLEYNDATGRGRIAVRLDGRDVSAAQNWALENIQELVATKNISLIAGQLPPQGAQYNTGNSRTTEDGLLEIEFSTR